MSTIFKQIIDKKIKTNLIYEDKLCIAFNDISPIAPIHVLIVPKKEIPTINDLTNDDKDLVSHLIFTAKNIAKEKNIEKSGYRLFLIAMKMVVKQFITFIYILLVVKNFKL